MKKKSIVLSLTMALMIGIGTTAYATTSNSETGKNFGQKAGSGMGMGRIGQFKGHNILTNLLKENGATDEEINSTLNSGKSLYDFAIEKGLTDEEIKAYMVSEKLKIIDEAVASGKMTAEQGEEAKTKIEENSADCTFKGEGNGRMNGIRGMKHGGHEVFTNLLKEKGVTDEEINSALDSNKSLYDLAIEKGLTDEEIKTYMVDQRIKSIDEAVANGNMTAEQGEEAKTKVQEDSTNWTFQNQGTKKIKGSMNSKGKMGMAKQRDTITSNE